MSTYAAKNHYKRTRPFQENHEPIAIPDARDFLTKDPSYPSGHTAVGWGFGLILAEIEPDRQDELLGCAGLLARAASSAIIIGSAM